MLQQSKTTSFEASPLYAPEIWKTFLFQSTAKDIWDVVVKTHSKKGNATRIFELKHAIHETKQRDLDVLSYFNKLKNPRKTEVTPATSCAFAQSSITEPIMCMKSVLKNVPWIVDSGCMEKGVHVPKMSANLLSISKLTKSQNYSVTFFSNRCVFQDLTRKTIGNAEKREGLYYLIPQDWENRAYQVKGSPTREWIFQKFYKMITIQFDAKVKVIRSHNGGEYFSGSLNMFLMDNGIIHESSCTATPEQNSVSSGENRSSEDQSQDIFPLPKWEEIISVDTQGGASGQGKNVEKIVLSCK
ncbi:hypothetical protein CK203_076170 [Vitis vinifera]|uniref:Retrovirus-related Pol polyprotein from transposon TNT 1-94 n=1 Tax=Vitis vinifera TaxID=29760 RepID=A0A438EEW3_VITVI|nr:hypothetical protein CK203_076170 [Vitis vinifera]